jgi:peptide/nickel transport system substrate-binding protein
MTERSTHLKALLLAASVAAAGAFAAAPPALGETVLKAKVHADLKNIDPIWTTAYISRNHGYLVWDTLFASDANYTIQPQMVDKWSVSADNLTYSFTLRDGLKFHDGAPVTSEDCIASIKRWGKRDGMGQKLMDVTAEMKAVDEKTFTLTLKEPYGLVLASLGKLSSNVPFMMPKRLAETDAFSQVPDSIGSGPFVFQKDMWVPGSKVVYKKFADYKPRPEPPSNAAGGKVVKVDVLEWDYIPDQNTAMNAILAGEIDYFEDPLLDLVPTLQASDDVQVKVVPLGSQAWLRINHLYPPFNNVKARQALQYMVNQEMYMQAVVGTNPELYKVCPAMFVCDTPFASDAGSERIMEFSIEKAKKLLKESGYNGEKVVLMHPTDTANLNAISLVSSQLLREVGFNLEVQAMDWSTLTSRRAMKEPLGKGGWSIFSTTWIGPDVMNPAVNIGTSGGCTEKAWFGWPCDEKIEELRGAFARATDPAEQKKIATEVQARANEVVTYIPLGQFFAYRAYRKSINGMIDSPVPFFWNIEKKT